MAMKIKVPEGMLNAAWGAVGAEMRECLHEGKGNTLAELHVARISVEAAIRWMIYELGKMKTGTNPTWDEAINRLCGMFVENEPIRGIWEPTEAQLQKLIDCGWTPPPESEVPEEIKDVFAWCDVYYGDDPRCAELKEVFSRVYRRGRNSK